MPNTDRRQGLSSSAAIKVPVKAATTANITLSGEQTIDGVSIVSGDRVLVKNQTTGSENGIYKASTSAWTREPDWDGFYDVQTGTIVYVYSGTANTGWWKVTTTGTITVGTTDVTIAASGLGDAEDVTYNQGGTGAVDRTQESKNQEFVSVKDFGADSTGVSDSSTAFTNALAVSATVYIPPGTYTLASTLVLPDGCKLYGHHPTNTTLNFTGTGAAIQAIGTLSPDNSYEQIWIEGFTLDGGKSSATSGNYGIEIAKTNDIRISDIILQNNGDHDIYLKGGNFQGSLDNLRFAGSYAWAVYVDQTGSYTRNNAFDMTRCLLYGTTYTGGIYLDQCNTWKMRSVRLESTTTDMTYLQSDNNVNLIELDTCYLENNSLTGSMIDLNGSSSAVRCFKIKNSTVSSASTSANTLLDMDNVSDALIEGNRFFQTDSSATSSFKCISTTANTGRVYDRANDFTVAGSAVKRSVNSANITADTYRINDGRRISETFYYDNLPASQTDTALNHNAGTAQSWTMPFSGTVVGFRAKLNAAAAGSTLTIDVRANGTKLSSCQATIPAASTTGTFYNLIDTTNATFSTGDSIDVVFTTDGSWTATTADLQCTVIVES